MDSTAPRGGMERAASSIVGRENCNVRAVLGSTRPSSEARSVPPLWRSAACLFQVIQSQALMLRLIILMYVPRHPFLKETIDAL